MSCLALLSLFASILPLKADSVTVVTIAGVLSSQDMCDYFMKAVDVINESTIMPPNLRFNATAIVMDPNPIRSAMSVCDRLLITQATAIIVSHPPPSALALTDPPSIAAPYISDLTTIPVSYTCGYYNHPVIGVSSRHVTLSNKELHPTLVRTVPPYFHQADVWVEMLQALSWERVVFIHSADEEGYAIYSRFVPHLISTNIRIEHVVTYVPGQSNFTEELMLVRDNQARIIVLYASEDDAHEIFKEAKELGMTGVGYGWLVTEQALESPFVPIGTLGLRLVSGSREKAHINDSLQLLLKAFTTVFQNFNITLPNSNCTFDDTKWQYGHILYKALLNSNLPRGLTGHVHFDSNGDRLNPVYHVINIHSDGGKVTGLSGTSRASPKRPIILIESDLVFPGNTSSRPTSVEIVHHLQVLTLGHAPFMDVKTLTSDNKCASQPGDSVVVCSHVNETTNVVTKYCCQGYSMDLLHSISEYANFTYDVTLTFDDNFGSLNYVNINGTSESKWTGIISDLITKRFDIIASPLTINAEHAKVIDFSKPFKFQGLTILAKKTAKESSLGSFLQPFDKTLWLLIMIAVHAVALSLYVLDRFSPFGRFKLMKSDDTEDDALNFSSAIWFTWSVLMNSGVGEGTPRSFSARVLGMVWAGFGMILIASYTANLAAFLVLDNRPEASISGIDDSRLRNPQDNFRFATIKHSAVNMFFRKKTEYSAMFDVMQKYNYDNVSDAIDDIKTGNLQAFIWDHARLEYEASLDCNLMTLGDMFGSWQYGLGIRKGLYWIKPINDAITRLSDEDELDRLNSKWLIERRVRRANCSLIDSVPATLGLTNMAGVFMMVGVGILAGLGLLVVEIGYKRHNRLRDKELELARNAADRWRTTVNKRRALRQAVNSDDVHRNSMCESLLRGVVSARTTMSSIPNTQSQPSITDNTAMLQAQAVAVFDNIM